MHCQTVFLLTVVALATALPAGPQKRQAYYFSPSAIYSNPYFGYSPYSSPIPYSSPSYSQRYLLFPPSGGSPSPSPYSGPFSPAAMGDVEHIPPPPPGSYHIPPPMASYPQDYPQSYQPHSYQPQSYQPQAQAQPQQPSQDAPVAFALPSQGFSNGGLLLVPLRDQTIGQGSGTDYISVLTNYLNQWIANKKPEKPPVGGGSGGGSVTEGGSGGGNYGPNKSPEMPMPEKAEKPEGEAIKPEAEMPKPEGAKVEGAKPEPAAEAPKPSAQRFLVITPPQLLNNAPSQDPASTYLMFYDQAGAPKPPSQRFLVANQPAEPIPPQDPSQGAKYVIYNQAPPVAPQGPQRRYLDPNMYPHPAYPSVNQIQQQQQPAGRSAMPEFVLGKNENRYGFVPPFSSDVFTRRFLGMDSNAGPNPHDFAAIHERRAYQPSNFFSQRRNYEDYAHADSVSVESALKDASNAASDDAATPTTSQPNAGNSTGSTDEEVVESGELGPSIAQVKPAAIALAGPGGVAAAAPVGTALVGPGGMALAAPSATAVAGPSGSAPSVVPAAAQAFANPTTYRKQIKNKGQGDLTEYEVIQDS